jgi:hypothetical protein
LNANRELPHCAVWVRSREVSELPAFGRSAPSARPASAG